MSETMKVQFTMRQFTDDEYTFAYDTGVEIPAGIVAQDYPTYVEVGIGTPYKRDEVCNIYKNMDGFHPSQVNWSAWGSQDADVTMHVGEALMFASRICSAINSGRKFAATVEEQVRKSWMK